MPFTIRSFRDPFVVAGRGSGVQLLLRAERRVAAAEARNYYAGAFACLAALLSCWPPRRALWA